jgi:uroporphyrinogen decarboxylase
MDIAALQKRFGKRLCFCGSMCVQSTLAWGSPRDVEREVRRRLGLFPAGGLFLGPTHAIQVGSPLENILTLYRTAGSLSEKIGDDILSLGSEDDQPARVNLAKLF